MSQNTVVQQPQPQPLPSQPVTPKQPWYQNRFWFGFFRSNYITAFWDWFMVFAGKAAEAILTLSVIYACARLLPKVHTSADWDNAVFVAQMIALDVGGLSLRKLANHAKQDGNTGGAQFASRVSTALIGIMLANVVLSIIQSITKIDPQAIAVVEGILLVARAVMAVLYAHVIHSLKRDDQGVNPSPVNPLPGFTLDDILTKIREEVHADQQQFLIEMNRVNQQALADVNQANRGSLDQVNRVNLSVNQANQEQITAKMEEVHRQNQAVIHAAIERLEMANSRRLEAVWTRLEQVSVTMETMESSPSLLAVSASTRPLGLPSREASVNQSEPPAVNQQSEGSEGFTANGVNQGSEGSQESKVNQVRGFTLNHFKEQGSLPTLTMIMAEVQCKKTLASRTRKIVATELGLTPVTEE